MQFKSGGQPLKGADNPFPEVDFPPTVSYDAVANILFAYGCREGIPRVLDLWEAQRSQDCVTHDRRGRPRTIPRLVRKTIARGHKASARDPR
jgi:hypothetical protein